MNDLSMASIEELTKELEAEATKLKEKLKAALLALPDNEKINRIGDRCFTIKMSDMGTENWTPFYHDFKMQYIQLAQVVDMMPLKSMTTRLKEIIRTGTYRQNNYTYHFHPEVTKHLANLLGVEKELAKS